MTSFDLFRPTFNERPRTHTMRTHPNADSGLSELFALGPVQLVDAAGCPEMGLLNRGFGRILSIFPRKKKRNTKFTKYSSVRTPQFY